MSAQDGQEELAGLMLLEPDIFEGLTTARSFEGLNARRWAGRLKAKAIIEDDTLDEPAKIDAIANACNWGKGDTTWLDVYLAGEASADETVAQKAGPIDQLYSSADYGRKFYDAEMQARPQRTYCKTPEEALAKLGPEQEFLAPEPDLMGTMSTENMLWTLWFSVLHAARRIPWDQQASQQERLVALVETFKKRPDPPLPSPITLPVKRDWIWVSGTLWSTLSMLGPSACEAWNTCCGTGAGWTIPEQHAWINVNAFVARLTASGTADFMNYGIGAVSSLEAKTLSGTHEAAPVPVMMSVVVQVASVWVEIAGQWTYERRARREDGTDDEDAISSAGEMDLSLRGGRLPWWRETAASAARWTFWRRRFEQEANNEDLTSQARKRGARAAELIHSFEQSRLGK